MDDDTIESKFSEKGTAPAPAGDFCPQCGIPVGADAITCPVDGTLLAQQLNAGVIIMGRYQLVSALGSGGMGAVYKAKQLVMDKHYAIKFLTAASLDKRAVQRFSREAKAVSRLDHHNIVKVFDVGETERGMLFMIMDLVEGKTLSELLKSSGQLPLNRSLDIFIQICEAMAHAHEHGILHRDLKPGNVMLSVNDDGSETVKILDFGIAKILQEPGGQSFTLTTTGEVMGSPVYMSPEQGAGTNIDQRSDIYSLGCLMFETLAGCPPLQGQTLVSTMMMHQNTKPPSMHDASMGLTFPPELEAAMQRCLAKDPSQRFQSMEELRSCLVDVRLGRKSSAGAARKELNGAGAALITEERGNLKRVAAITALCSVIAVGLAFGFVQLFKRTGDARSALEAPQQAVLQQASTVSPVVEPPSTAQDATGEAGVSADDDAYWTKEFSKGERRWPAVNMSSARLSHGVWAQLQKLAHINELDVRESNFSDADAKYLVGPHIIVLLIARTAIGNEAMKEIGRIQQLFTLEINEDKRITDAGLRYLEHHPSLAHLYCSFSSIYGDGLAFLHDCPRLIDLDLSNSKNIGPAGFANLERLPHLQRLLVNGTSFDDSCARHLLRLKKLSWLELRKCRITDQTLEVLGQIPTLTKLDLTSTRITRKGLEKLRGLKNLEYINVRKSQRLAQEDIDNLRKSLPLRDE